MATWLKYFPWQIHPVCRRVFVAYLHFAYCLCILLPILQQAAAATPPAHCPWYADSSSRLLLRASQRSTAIPSRSLAYSFSQLWPHLLLSCQSIYAWSILSSLSFSLSRNRRRAFLRFLRTIYHGCSFWALSISRGTRNCATARTSCEHFATCLDCVAIITRPLYRWSSSSSWTGPTCINPSSIRSECWTVIRYSSSTPSLTQRSFCVSHNHFSD